jgi:hypothetical protein
MWQPVELPAKIIPVKKVIIASFQRSGTHFLINHLATNFQGIEDGWVDIFNNEMRRAAEGAERTDFRVKIGEQLRDYHPTPGQRCVKTHFQAYFLEPHWEAIREKYDVLYIVRDPRDTMVACYHYYNLTRFEAFIQEPVFAKFLRADLRPVKTETDPFSYSHVKPRNIVDKWNQHVLSWLPYRDRGVHFVRFSDLKFRWQETLQAIESKTSQRLKPALQEVLISDKRVRPDFKRDGIRRGEVGIWRNYFSADDLEFLNQNVSAETTAFFDDEMP